jgi:hypothetical protein
MHLDPTSGWPSFKERKGNGAEHIPGKVTRTKSKSGVVVKHQTDINFMVSVTVKGLFRSYSGAVPLYHSL